MKRAHLTMIGPKAGELDLEFDIEDIPKITSKRGLEGILILENKYAKKEYDPIRKLLIQTGQTDGGILI